MEYVLSWSGGKDSTVMLLEVIRRGLPLDYIIFCDTTFEFPEMYQYIDKIENYIGIEVVRLKPESSFDDWFYSNVTRGRRVGCMRGFPYQCMPCYWQRESKVKPKAKFLKNIGLSRQYIGYTSDEKNRIMKGSEFIYPLIEWDFSENDCLNYLKKLDLLNPLYKKFGRTGCYWCHKQPLSALEIVCKDYPEQWQWIKKYEIMSPHGYRHNFSCLQFEKEIK